MKRALLISTENPFPADSGGRLRLRGILEVLAGRFSIDLVTYARPESDELQRARARMNIVQVPRTVTRTAAAFRSLYLRRNVGYMGHADVDMMGPARALCATESYHTVFIDNTMLGYFIPHLRRLQPRARFVTIAHNFETSLCRQLADEQRSVTRRALFSLSARHTRRVEERVCRQTDLLLSTSPAEVEEFASLVPDVVSKTVVVPSCIDAGRYARYRDWQPEPDSVVFAGDMAYFPNVAAVEYFHTRIQPLLRARRPAATVQLVGRNPHPSIQAIADSDPSVSVTGWVADAAEHIARSAVVIVPLRHGSGTRLKILEAWALDRPVVTTSKGCEGLECRSGHDLIVADDPDAFVDGICRLLDDRAYADRMVRHARATLLSRYDIGMLPGRLTSVHDGPAGGDGAASPS